MIKDKKTFLEDLPYLKNLYEKNKNLNFTEISRKYNVSRYYVSYMLGRYDREKIFAKKKVRCKDHFSFMRLKKILGKNLYGLFEKLYKIEQTKKIQDILDLDFDFNIAQINYIKKYYEKSKNYDEFFDIIFNNKKNIRKLINYMIFETNCSYFLDTQNNICVEIDNILFIFKLNLKDKGFNLIVKSYIKEKIKLKKTFISFKEFFKTYKYKKWINIK